MRLPGNFGNVIEPPHTHAILDVLEHDCVCVGMAISKKIQRVFLCLRFETGGPWRAKIPIQHHLDGLGTYDSPKLSKAVIRKCVAGASGGKSCLRFISCQAACIARRFLTIFRRHVLHGKLTLRKSVPLWSHTFSIVNQHKSNRIRWRQANRVMQNESKLEEDQRVSCIFFDSWSKDAAESSMYAKPLRRHVAPAKIQLKLAEGPANWFSSPRAPCGFSEEHLML